MGKKFDMLALGEVLLRLSPEGNERLAQGTRFEKQLGGAELNVAVGAANLGLTAGIISKIPSHAIGNYAKREIRRNGVDTDYCCFLESLQDTMWFRFCVLYLYMESACFYRI